MKIDLLCFGAHSDDVELGMGGTLAKYTQQGKTAVICDLTEAELSSNGTPENRKKEAQAAAEVLGVKERINLNMGDRNLFITPDNIAKVAAVIRRYQPELIFAPYHIDRHPDHGRVSQLVFEAVFSAGIRKYTDQDGQESHKPTAVYEYMINSFHKPDFCVDISSSFDKKIEALKCYRSQFERSRDGVITPLTEGYLEAIEGRERAYGRDAGVLFAEGFKTTKPLILDADLFGASK
ncbi:deacetylase [Bacillus sp. FJAT-27916]|uniref:bacillithiol biosynthesis deacetylase BshB1 n=1 Tax=Bacillaceae TaxID=186817 RepID=UPI00067110DE|nr:bacillithiol biosynthesis deacetylase BshB1 [Bacillus sp. FJAT-27916]KMY44187.1 deacetylase [Bacillus sp. FJAT-27916]